MSNFDEKINFYREKMHKIEIPYKDELLSKILRGLGPFIFKRDAVSVSIYEEKDILTVKFNFLSKNLV